MSHGGIGYSWFKITLINEYRRSAYLTAYLKMPQKLQGTISRSTYLIGTLKSDHK